MCVREKWTSLQVVLCTSSESGTGTSSACVFPCSYEHPLYNLKGPYWGVAGGVRALSWVLSWSGLRRCWPRWRAQCFMAPMSEWCWEHSQVPRADTLLLSPSPASLSLQTVFRSWIRRGWSLYLLLYLAPPASLSSAGPGRHVASISCFLNGDNSFLRRGRCLPQARL